MLYYRFYMLYAHFSAKSNRISFIFLRICIKKQALQRKTCFCTDNTQYPRSELNLVVGLC